MLKYITVLFLIFTMDVSIGQVVLTQTQNDATIGLDRKAWAGLGNTAPLSDGYAHDFTLPTSTNSCEQITDISVEVNFTGYTNNGVCPHFETYFNLFYGCTTYAGGATCLPTTNLIAEPNYPVNVNPQTFNFGNPLGSPLNSDIEPDFGDNFSIDIIPVSNSGCNAVSNGHISHQYTITVTVTTIDTTPAAPTGLECWETAVFNNTTCIWDVTGTQPLAPTGLECWETAVFNNTTCIWDVTGTQPLAPIGLACWETATFNNTTCIWEVTGTQPLAPTGLACWETATFNDTTCVWDVSGTQPTQPVIECWETAVFNNTTCIWDVTGTQPTQPVIECWETVVFNSTTCIWEVTGTQPSAPTGLECWETATFNNTTCIWEVTGTQPLAPTGLACWETATFNNTTCIWEVTGTQPLAPTGLACWETATFNDTTCVWDVSGTQPTQPVIECWETAVFNNTTCIWDVSGTQPMQTREEFVELCDGELPLIATSSILNPEYEWDSGEITQSISVGEAGIYEVVVTNGCLTDIITFNVTEIEPPVIQSIISQQSSIIINVLGNDTYQYSIDGINYQSSNVFYNLPTGLYNIHVRNDDCNFIVRQEHFHLYIQKYMTPNGDGNNDLFSLNLAPFFSNFKVYIFDRYGKLLYSVTNTNARWNGTFNGNLMPTADYWYSIILDNQSFTGHFTLKR